MSYLPWQEQYSVGVKEFDDDHKQLFDCTNELGKALEDGEDQESIRKILKDLLKYTRVHFRNEEINMIFYEYPEYKEHKIEHEELSDEVVEFALDFAAKPHLVTVIMSFLQNWILQHMLVSDKKYSEFFADKEIIEWE
jgi:hemerythrin-like metal-binding protein